MTPPTPAARPRQRLFDLLQSVALRRVAPQPRIVKVDCLLDETHSQRARVEIEIAVGPSRNCGHVMDA
jgi:hypothetical protein